MAKATLPTNFKDDILANGMSGKRRYNMIQNSDGTVSFDDVTNYTQVGSTFGAAQINATNKAVNNAADASKIIDNLDTIKANTQSGYIAGALAVKALDSNLGKWNYLGSKTGASEITLPSGFEELHIVVNIGNLSASDSWCRAVYNIISGELTDTLIPYQIGGYMSSGDNFSAVVFVNKTTLKLTRGHTANVDRTNNTTVYVYYR